MTISTNPDRSDVYNPSMVKSILPKVMDELHGNSVFTRIINKLCPKGIDTSKMGRISSSKYRSYGYSKTINTKDGIYRLGRTLDTEDGIIFKVNLCRGIKWDRANGGNVFGDEFCLNIDIIDRNLTGLYAMKRDYSGMYFRSREYAYDPMKDFEAFVIGRLADDFNNNAPEVQSYFDERCKTLAGIHAATARY